MPKKRQNTVTLNQLASLIKGVEQSVRGDISGIKGELKNLNSRVDEGLTKTNKTYHTLNDLALMIKKGFDARPTREEMNHRFNLVDKRFDAVEKRLTSLEQNNSIVQRVKDALAL